MIAMVAICAVNRCLKEPVYGAVTIVRDAVRVAADWLASEIGRADIAGNVVTAERDVRRAAVAVGALNGWSVALSAITRAPTPFVSVIVTASFGCGRVFTEAFAFRARPAVRQHDHRCVGSHSHRFDIRSCSSTH